MHDHTRQSHALPSSMLSILRCPDCGASLAATGAGASCTRCHLQYARGTGPALDLRLQRPKRATATFALGTPLVPSDFSFGVIGQSAGPEVDFGDTAAPQHLSRELLSHFPRARSESSIALDLGCGSGLHRAVCERAGYQWLGIDYSDPGALLLADAHSLPLTDESVDFILSIAVLEHVRYPAIALREAWRVLKPGGTFIGTVAFLEPFHGDSLYHHSHLGTLNALQDAGFTVNAVGPNPRWSGLRAMATMGGLFPRIPKPIGRGLILPLELLHRLWWAAGRIVRPSADEKARQLTNAGSFEFIATKPT